MIALVACVFAMAGCSKSVESVSLNKTALTLTVGATETLKATVTPDDASKPYVKWSTSNAGVATVDADGKVTGVAKGEAVIIVTTEDGGMTDTCTVTVVVPVESGRVTGVTLSKTSLSLMVGKSQVISPTVMPEDATDKTFTWSTDDSSVATISGAGRVSAVGIGTTTITVKTNDGNKTAVCYVTVTANEVSNIGLNKQSVNLSEGDQETLVVYLFPIDVDDASVSWSSENSAVAVVHNGVITGMGVGTTVVTATANSGGKTATCTVTVSARDYSGYTAISTIADYLSIQLNGKYYLANDIDFAGANVTAIGDVQEYGVDGLGNPAKMIKSFTGVFDGRGYAIRNAKFVAWQDISVAMFGKLDGGAVVRNVSLINCFAEGDVWCAAVAASAQNCLIENCYVEATVDNKHLDEGGDSWWDPWCYGGGITCINGSGSVIRGCFVDITAKGYTVALVGTSVEDGVVENCVAVEYQGLKLISDENPGGGIPKGCKVASSAKSTQASFYEGLLNPYYWTIADGNRPSLKQLGAVS